MSREGILAYAIVGVFGLFAAGMLYKAAVGHTPDTHPVLVECQPVVRTDPTIRVVATQASIHHGVTCYTAEDGEHITSMPCHLSELGGQ